MISGYVTCDYLCVTAWWWLKNHIQFPHSPHYSKNTYELQIWHTSEKLRDRACFELVRTGREATCIYETERQDVSLAA